MKNQEDQSLFNNNNQVPESASNKDELFPVIKGKIEYDYETIVRQINEHSYIVSFDKLQQDIDYHSGKSTLTDIYNDFISNKENLMNNDGVIHMKEYTLDSYQCRCHEHNELLDDKKIDLTKQMFNYKLEF
ncbi:hypothetical protein I4U23_020672 [Adineta vaga]|nr:hypothetical protein I4U23_020672 [Adineta vaga]